MESSIPHAFHGPRLLWLELRKKPSKNLKIYHLAVFSAKFRPMGPKKAEQERGRCVFGLYWPLNMAPDRFGWSYEKNVRVSQGPKNRSGTINRDHQWPPNCLPMEFSILINQSSLPIQWSQMFVTFPLVKRRGGRLSVTNRRDIGIQRPPRIPCTRN